MMSTPKGRGQGSGKYAFGAQNAEAACEALVTGQNLKMVSGRNRADEDVDRAVLDSVIPAEIE
jgi:hypothetical protein